MAFYSSVDCGYGTGSHETVDGCITNYADSEIKYAVDAWKSAKAPLATEARLILFDELIDNLGYEWGTINPSTEGWKPSSSTPSWVYNDSYWYWTDSETNNSGPIVWIVYRSVFLGSGFVSTPADHSSSGLS